MILDEKNTHEPDIEHGYSYDQYLYINQNIYKCLHLYYLMLTQNIIDQYWATQDMGKDWTRWGKSAVV